MPHLVQTFVAGVAGAATVVVLLGAASIQTDGNVETGQQLVSKVPNGTPPLVVQSSTTVPRLNADKLDGVDATAFATAANTYSRAEVDALLAAQRDARRAFYLTASTYHGAQADGSDGNGAGVCAAGFHFASMWEILDVSGLRYATDTEAGGDVQRQPDSGQGPPAIRAGWVRTGVANSGSATEGLGNCSGWTSSSGGDRGAIVALEQFWASATGSGNPSVVLAPWDSAPGFCSGFGGVWCVEDFPGAAS